MTTEDGVGMLPDPTETIEVLGRRTFHVTTTRRQGTGDCYEHIIPSQPTGLLIEVNRLIWQWPLDRRTTVTP